MPEDCRKVSSPFKNQNLAYPFLTVMHIHTYIHIYRIFPNKRRPLTSAAPLDIHIEISASVLKVPPFNKRRTSKYGAYKNSYYILLKAKQKCIWT